MLERHTHKVVKYKPFVHRPVLLSVFQPTPIYSFHRQTFSISAEPEALSRPKNLKSILFSTNTHTHTAKKRNNHRSNMSQIRNY